MLVPDARVVLNVKVKVPKPNTPEPLFHALDSTNPAVVHACAVKSTLLSR